MVAAILFVYFLHFTRIHGITSYELFIINACYILEYASVSTAVHFL